MSQPRRSRGRCSLASGSDASLGPRICGIVSSSDRIMRRLGVMDTGPPPPGCAVDAVGVQAGHAGVVGQRTELLVAGLAGDAMAKNQGVTGPGPPLAGLVGAAEKDHRERSRRGGEMSRAGIRTDEQVGSFQKRRGLRDAQPARSSREAARDREAPRPREDLPGPPTTMTRQPSWRNL